MVESENSPDNHNTLKISIREYNKKSRNAKIIFWSP